MATVWAVISSFLKHLENIEQICINSIFLSCICFNQYKQDIKYFNIRHNMRGGITGWAQINGRSVLTRRPEHKARYDIYYIKNFSFIFDLKIIMKTIVMVLKGEEAY